MWEFHSDRALQRDSDFVIHHDIEYRYLPLSFLSNQIHHRQHSLYDRTNLGIVFVNDHSQVFQKSLIDGHNVNRLQIPPDDFHIIPIIMTKK